MFKSVVIGFLLFVGSIAQAAETVKVAGSDNSAWSSLKYLPEFCKKYDLNVEYYQIPAKLTVSAMLVAVDRGEYDIVGFSSTSGFIANQNGADLFIIGNTSVGGVSLVAKPGITKITELKGKRVGSMRGSGSEMTFLMSLSKNGLTYEGDNPDVILVNMPVTVMGQAMIQGEVDAVVHTYPEMLEEINRGKGVAIETYNNQYRPLYATSKLGESRAKKFKQCLNDMYASLNTKSSDDLTKASKAGVVLPTIASVSYKLKPSVTNAELQEIANFMVKTGKLKSGYTVTDKFNQSK